MRWKSLRPTEHQEQAVVIEWTLTVHATMPEASLIFAIPNGGMRPQRFNARKGRFISSEGKKLKAEGVKSGVLDLFLPVPRNEWHGLFIEMKRIGERTSPNQDAWAKLLSEQGYAVCICQGADSAIAGIKGYLSNPRWAPFRDR